MMKTTKELLEKAKDLPLTERAALVEALLETIDASDSVLEQRWADEAQSRLRAFESGELSAIDADEVITPYARIWKIALSYRHVQGEQSPSFRLPHPIDEFGRFPQQRLALRVCLRFENGDAFDVEIVDYH